MSDPTAPLEFDLVPLLQRAWDFFARHVVAFIVATVIGLAIILVAASAAALLSESLSVAVCILLSGPLAYGIFDMALGAVWGRAPAGDLEVSRIPGEDEEEG